MFPTVATYRTPYRPVLPQQSDRRTHPDEAIRLGLQGLVRDEPDLTFNGTDGRDQIHDIAQYPAMMVPRMQGAIIDTLIASGVRIDRVFDPFMGSGTTLVECVRRRLFYLGCDINPYAVLLSRVKAAKYRPWELGKMRDDVVGRIKKDRVVRVEVDFAGWQKWFSSGAAIEFSTIRRAIRKEPDLRLRRLLWVALGETVRTTSNSRTSTFKLHLRPAAELKARPSPEARFFSTLDRIIKLIVAEAPYLATNHVVTDGPRRRRPILRVADIHDLAFHGGPVDLMITSPPYGDNATTVPYGQFSFLPLQWIDLTDIDGGAHADSIKNTHALDSASIGGGRRGTEQLVPQLREVAPSFGRFLDNLPDGTPPDRRSRVTAFVRDLDSALRAALPLVREGGYLVWTVGNRRVGGHPVPLDAIVRELMKTAGAVNVTTLQRTIPQKRMALKNSVSATMRAEHVVVARRG